MNSIENDAAASTVAVGWLFSDETRTWQGCTLSLCRAHLRIEGELLDPSKIALDEIGSVDQIDESAGDAVRIEVLLLGGPALCLALPDSFVSALLHALHLSLHGPAVDAAVAVVSGHSAAKRHGGRRALEAEVERLRFALAELGVQELAELEARLVATRSEIESARIGVAEELAAERARVAAELDEQQRRAESRRAVLQDQIGRFQRAADRTRATLKAEEAALARFRAERELDPVDRSIDLSGGGTAVDGPRLASVRTRIVAMGKRERAVTTTRSRSSAPSPQGRKVALDVSKLMVRAYDAEAERLVQSMRPGQLDASLEQLAAARDEINMVGRTLGIAVSQTYHRLRVEELELVAERLAGAAGMAKVAAIDLRGAGDGQPVSPAVTTSPRGAQGS